MNLPGQKIRKVKTVGIGRGWGASAFFFKQVKEMHRHSPLVFWGGSTIMLAAVGAFISIVMMNSGDDGEPMSSSLIMMVATITFPQRGRPLEQGNDEAVFVYGSAKSL